MERHLRTCSGRRISTDLAGCLCRIDELQTRYLFVGTEMAVHVPAYDLKRVMNIIGIGPLIVAWLRHKWRALE